MLLLSITLYFLPVTKRYSASICTDARMHRLASRTHSTLSACFEGHQTTMRKEDVWVKRGRPPLYRLLTHRKFPDRPESLSSSQRKCRPLLPSLYASVNTVLS